jgi:hypothetical protein
LEEEEEDIEDLIGDVSAGIAIAIKLEEEEEDMDEDCN